MNWKCRECGALNSEMTEFCMVCRRGREYGCSCSCMTVIMTFVVIATLAVIAVALGKDRIRGMKEGVKTEASSVGK